MAFKRLFLAGTGEGDTMPTMNNALGRWLRKQRETLGLSLSQVASLVGVSFSTVARWERGDFSVPERSLAALAAALNVSQADLASRRVHRSLGLPPELEALRLPVEKLPAYESRGTVADMLALGPEARSAYSQAQRLHPLPAVHEEMADRFPRDSILELLAAYRLLAAGAVLTYASLLALGFRGLVVPRGNLSHYVGDAVRPMLVLHRGDDVFVAVPQVSMAVVAQSRERRADFLLLLATPDGRIWIDLEIDGGLNLRNANDDARRAVGLALPRLSRTSAQVLRADFVPRLLDAADAIMRDRRDRAA